VGRGLGSISLIIGWRMTASEFRREQWLHPMRNIIVVFFVWILCSAGWVTPAKAQTTQPISKDGVELLENWVSSGGQSGIEDRQIFIFIPERLFSPERVASLFDQYQREFCDPYILMIFVFTDRNALKKQFAYETKTTVFVDFADTEAGRKASIEYYSKLLPPQTGYFRAEYSRYGDYEQYSYMTAKDSPLTTRVMLRSPNIKSSQPNVCKKTLSQKP